MWCANCQDDVATEISEDAQSLKCITCGEIVRKVFAPSLHPQTKTARDLLQKWAEEQKEELAQQTQQQKIKSSEPQVQSPDAEVSAQDNDVKSIDSDAIGTVESIDSNEEVTQVEANSALAADQKSQPKFRVDAAHEETILPGRSNEHQVSEMASSEPHSQNSDPTDSEQSDLVPDVDHRRHLNHTIHEQAPAPHFDVAVAAKQAKKRPGRSEAIWGQLLAYAGVGILTVGTVLVLWGYFGMIEQYASTGWLLSTAGQMLLLLGIVTLVSGGMQQTTHEVTERIEYLGGRMMRIEESTEKLLSGPHFNHQREQKRKKSLDESSSDQT